MKKIFAITLVLVMMLAMSVTVFAEGEITSITENNTKENNIVVTVTSEYVDPDKTYYVVVDWTDTTIEIKNTVSGATWNPEDHIYEDGNTTSSVEGQAAVTVTNHSNAAVKATVSALNFNVTGLTVDCEGPAVLDDASEVAYGAPGSADSEEIAITVAKDTNETVIAEGTYNFTVTVTITAP
ncbi:MAG: hypothetical protein E7587_02045 [Ruminococcaceae bacterium]|nr:hypothetical protein [Oscillospiraceae bacterium]